MCSRFSPYNILATITDFNTSSTATASITGVNGDGGDYWDYYADGSTASGGVTKNLTYDSEISKWVSSNVYPDSIYPEIYFAPSAITWDNTPLNTVIRRNNYQLLHYSNPFTVTGNMTFWVEFNAYRRSQVNSADLQVYVAGSGHDITYFQNDWRNFADVELVGTINKNSDFNHTHTENSSHHLVALSTNSDETLGAKNLNISGDFWVILYSTSPNDARGWDFRYQPADLCDNNSRWYAGSQSGWTTTLQSGCPDAHIHVARRSDGDGIKDGVKVITSATENGLTGTDTSVFYFNELPNLPPNITSFLHPNPGDTYAGDININWEPATDPNNDTLSYYLYLLDESGNQVGDPLLENSSALSFLLQTSVEGAEIANGDYSLKGRVCDQEPLCTEYTLDGTFTVDNTDPISTLNSIAITSSNSNNTIAKAGDQVTLSFVASAPIGVPSVVFYSGGNDVADSPVLPTSANGTEWLATYTVNSADTSGEISFVISAHDLDANYYETTNSSLVGVDVDAPAVISLSPVNGAGYVEVDSNLVVDFSENVATVGGKNIVIKKSADNSLFATIAADSAMVTVSGARVTINPELDFTDKQQYYVQIDEGTFVDGAGNLFAGIVNAETWVFTVGDIVAPMLDSVSIVSNNEDNTKATVNNVVTLLFSANEEIGTPTIQFSSGGQAVQDVSTVINTVENNWSATYTVKTGDKEGLVSFVVSYQDLEGNGGQPVATTTDASSVEIFFASVPSVTTTSTASTAITTSTPSTVSNETASESSNEPATPRSSVATPSASTQESYGEVELYNIKILVKNNGVPMAQTRVELYSNVRSRVADEKGVVYFSNVEPGVHKVKIFLAQGAVEKEISVGGSEKTIDYELEIAPSVENTADKAFWRAILYLLPAVALVVIVRLILRNKGKRAKK
ncbi:Ig-like domain-containing protein [Patescibacteria group bacterium]|nr:Ig-like domain-containing protein [Patescibacteria group bacterium]